MGAGCGITEKEEPKLLDLNPLLDLNALLDLNPLLDLKEYSTNFRGVCFKKGWLCFFLFIQLLMEPTPMMLDYLIFYNTFFLLILSLPFFTTLFILKPLKGLKTTIFWGTFAVFKSDDFFGIRRPDLDASHFLSEISSQCSMPWSLQESKKLEESFTKFSKLK